MELYYQSYPQDFVELSAAQRVELSPHSPVIIIPGLFGSTVNWRSFAKILSQLRPVIVIDQRNHGRSPHADSHSYQDMVDDLNCFIERHKLGKVILCGHSMGGKVAMLFALMHVNLVEKLAVLDVSPVSYTHSHAPFLEELLKVDLAGIQSRRDADRELALVIPDTATRLFLLQNLAGTAGSFYWRINLSVLHQDMPKIVAFPDLTEPELTNSCQTIVISAANSDYVQPQHHAKIRDYFSKVSFQVIPDAGHWLHAEQPDAVLQALIDFIRL